MKSKIKRFIAWLDEKYPTGEPDAQMRAFSRDHYLSGYRQAKPGRAFASRMADIAADCAFALLR